MKIRRMLIFLKDVLILSISAFGGPQAHVGMLYQKMVEQRKYITEKELLELNSLCQLLPGPTSTQTIVALAFKLGGVRWAYYTLIVWCAPAVLMMLTCALFINIFSTSHNHLTTYLAPVAIGCMMYAAYKVLSKVITNAKTFALMLLAGLVAFIFKSPWLFPVLLILGGVSTAVEYKKYERIENKIPVKIEWFNFFLWLTLFTVAAILSTHTDWLPMKVFQKFYRNGSLVFGGGQVLIPMLYTEFVQFKNYLTPDEFNIGYAMVHLIPGPVFSISSYIGALAAKNYGIHYQIICGLSAAIGLFLPGTLLIFFLFRFWEQLKQYRGIKASLEGINAINVGLMLSAIASMFIDTPHGFFPILIMGVTFILLQFGKVPTPFVILGALVLGLIF